MAENVGRHREGLQHLEAIRQNSRTPLAAYVLIASEQIVRGKFSAAERTIRTGERYYYEDFFLPARLQLVSARKDWDRAAVLYARCKASPIESLEDVCDDIIENRGTAAVESGDPNLHDKVFEVFEGLATRLSN